MSVVEELRQNDPANTCIRIWLHGEASDAALAQALEQNPFVTDIVLSMDEEQRVDWDSLLRVIAMRGNLETVRLLQDSGRAEHRNAPAALVCSILRAIQQNTAIRIVGFAWLRLPTTISTFVDNASSMTSFELYQCDMEPAQRQQEARSLAAAIQRNTNIETLSLRELDDIYTVPILEGLQSNTSLRTFLFSPPSPGNVSDETSHALHQVLESTTSIERIGFDETFFFEPHLFRPIAQAITNSECVSQLQLSECLLEDGESFAHLRSILQNKQNLSSLCFSDCAFGGEFIDPGQIYTVIASILLRPGSLLRCFEFYCGELEQTIPVIKFKNLLRAMEKSKLERFQIGSIETPRYLQVLIQSIPLMKLKELEIDFWDNEGSDDEDEAEGEFDRETIRQDLLNAVKNNFSLRSLKAELSETDLFDNDDKQTLAFYANRNAILDQWVDKPEIVEQYKVWPDALNLAQKAGPDALFRGLRSVLESDYGSLPGGRKRKRPQYYSPA